MSHYTDGAWANSVYQTGSYVFDDDGLNRSAWEYEFPVADILAAAIVKCASLKAEADRVEDMEKARKLRLEAATKTLLTERIRYKREINYPFGITAHHIRTRLARFSASLPQITRPAVESLLDEYAAAHRSGTCAVWGYGQRDAAKRMEGWVQRLDLLPRDEVKSLTIGDIEYFGLLGGKND